MNLQTRPAASSTALVAAAPRNRQTPSADFRREGRARDFGIGYGRSSGYASSRRYASNWGNTRFEFC
jgi:hypothetical protein